MADIKQLESALVKADAAGNADDARALAAEIRRMRAATPEAIAKETSIGEDIAQGAGNLIAGGFRGAGSIGATILSPIDAAARALNNGKPWSVNGYEIAGMDRRAGMDAGLKTMGADTDSGLFKTGKLAAEIAGTSGVGGALAKGAQAVGAAPSVVNALATSGMRAGTTPGVVNMLTRIGGGATTGGAAAGLIDPEQAGAGALIGGALPPVLAGAGAIGRKIGQTAGSIVKPFTAKGQDEIAGKIVSTFADGGPTTLNRTALVPGSQPTLAEASGNAGLATLQRGVRDIRPNAFAEREALNAAARNNLFENVAGDAGQLEFNRASRAAAADGLYGQALNQSNVVPPTPYVKGQVTQLLKRPSINEASKTAQKLALERGEKPAAMGSIQALHDVKTALDDKIGEAITKNKGGEAKALQATKDKLLDVMEKLSPAYGEARVTYAEMSKPINAMETLQSLKIGDAQGNITLAKVQNALQSLQKKMNAPGANAAKSVTGEQLQALTAIRDDLLRQSNLSLGKSIGSNTFQNIATDNIIGSVGGQGLSNLAQKTGIAGIAGQIGKLAYSGPNEAIRNRLADMMLNPELAQNALSRSPTIANQNRLLNGPLSQFTYRAAPALVAD